MKQLITLFLSYCFLIFNIFFFVVVESNSIECQQWKKESGQAVIFDKYIKCDICSMSIIHRDNTLHYEGGCYRGPGASPKEECVKTLQNGNEVFICTCITRECNNYPILLQRAYVLNATEYLKSPIPDVIRSNSAASHTAILPFVCFVIFVTILL